ncbi:MAG TPA: hypothetical protein VHZ95_15310, partial [Polyangiales bacterium]|nr:hypothetical protein [Polyangiales bacterium]
TAPLFAPKLPEPSEADPRALKAHATFGDLVDAARALDGSNENHSDAGCLLRGRDPIRLEADLSPGARPLPPVQDELASSLEAQSGPVALLSAWGKVAGEPGVVLLALTTTTPAAIKLPVISLFMTRKGTYVRGEDAALRARPGALSASDATTLLSQLSSPAAVYVSAEREIALSSLLDLMRAIPNRFEVGLAVALPKETRLPPTAATSNDWMCPDGLPAPGPSEHEGELTASDARDALAPLRQAALSCALASGGRALLGGRLVLSLRIGANGKAEQSCFASDAIGEAQLRRCLISAARDVQLPSPHPAGFVDLNVPLEIALEGPSAQRVSCD